MQCTKGIKAENADSKTDIKVPETGKHTWRGKVAENMTVWRSGRTLSSRRMTWHQGDGHKETQAAKRDREREGRQVGLKEQRQLRHS